MIPFALRRILLLVPVLWAVASVVWLVMFALPGDPVRLLAGQVADPATVGRIRAEWGLDAPLHYQYGLFMTRLARLDFGASHLQGERVSKILFGHLPATAVLALTAMLLALLIGVAFGALAAAAHGTRLDATILGASLVGVSTPVFWLGMMLVVVFASGRGLGWLPVSGYGAGPVLTLGSGAVAIRLPGWRHLILPALTLALVVSGPLVRITRSTLLDVLGQDYVRMARARGLSWGRVVFRHALRNALIPVATMAGMDLAGLFGGAIATESIFAWPGLGKAIVRAIHSRDLPVVEGGVLMLTTAFVLATLAIDLLYGWLDPRLRAP